jgi:hypothetical protein
MQQRGHKDRIGWLGRRLNCWWFGFVPVLSRIPSTKNKIHHRCAEIRHDSDHPFREKPP